MAMTKQLQPLPRQGLLALFLACCPSAWAQTLNISYSPNGNLIQKEQTTANNAAIIGVQLLCEGDSLELSASQGGSYAWSHGPATQDTWVEPDSNATYTVVVTFANGCSDAATATVPVRMNPYPHVLVEDDDTLLAPNESITLEADTGSTYEWSTGATTQSISVQDSGLYWVKVDSCFYSDTVHIGLETLKLSAKVFLEGPYNSGTGLMGDQLRSASLVPLGEPYTAIGYAHADGGGSESTTAAVLSSTGSNAVVDWVVLELRDASNSTQVLYTRSALLQRDGDVVDTDGIRPVEFFAPAGSYYVAIRHRNHLGAMAASPLALNSATATNLDFTSGALATYGTDARKTIGFVRALWAGNVIWDNLLKYTGILNDRDPILVKIGGVIPTNTMSGYFVEDVNLSGLVKYTGSENDRDPILVNIGGVVPTNIRSEQLP